MSLPAGLVRRSRKAVAVHREVMANDAQGNVPLEQGAGGKRALNTRLVRGKLPTEAEHFTVELRDVSNAPTLSVTLNGESNSSHVTISQADERNLIVVAWDAGGSRRVILRDPGDVFQALRFAGRWLRTNPQGQGVAAARSVD